MEFKLSPEFQKLDKKISRLYNATEKFYSDVNNPLIYNLLTKELSSTERLAYKLKPKTEFENIFLENALSAVSCAKTDAGFLNSFETSTERLIDIVYGKGSYDLIKNDVRNYDWKAEYELERVRTDILKRSIPLTPELTRKLENEIFPALKDEILDYSLKEGLAPKNLDFKLRLSEEKGAVYWNLKTKSVVLPKHYIGFYDQNGRALGDLSFAYPAIFHEFFGHAVHQFNSGKMPPSLRFESKVGNIKSTRVVSEGIAMEKDLMARDYVINKYGINRFTENLRLFFKTAQQNSAREIYISLLAIKKFRNPDFDQSKGLSDVGITNPVWARYLSNKIELMAKNYDLAGMQTISHFLGQHYMKNLRRELEEEFGKEFTMKNKDKINLALTSGDWTPEAHKKFVKFFLKNTK
jgi:hypothetical protein